MLQARQPLKLKSNRYANVQGKVDSGFSVNKFRPLSTQEIIRRREEDFFRISRDDLEHLLRSEYKPDLYSQSLQCSPNHSFIIYDVRSNESFEQGSILSARYAFILII